MKFVYIDLQNMSSLKSEQFQFFIKQVVGKRPFVLIVTAAFCPHCVAFKPPLSKALKTLGATKKIVADARFIVQFSDETSSHIVRNHQDSLLGQILRNNVTGYPTFLYASQLLKDEMRPKNHSVGGNNRNTMNILHFENERTAENIADFIRNMKN